MAAARAVAVWHAFGHEVGPLGHIGLAQDDCPGVAQPGYEIRVRRREGIGQGKRPGTRVHPVAGVDVVLENDRDAVKRAQHLSRLSRRIKPGGDRLCIRVELQDSIDAGSRFVTGGDSLHERMNDVARRELPVFLPVHNLDDRQLFGTRTHVYRLPAGGFYEADSGLSKHANPRNPV